MRIALLTLIALASSHSSNAVHVGVIGAGASGLTSAYLLQNQGYDVTVMEASSAVGGVARTEMIQGEAFDMATMFVPGGGLHGAGIEPTLKRLIDVSEETLIEAVDFDTLNVSDGTLSVIPENLQEYSHSDLVSQIFRGLNESTRMGGCLAQGIDCVTCGVCADINEGALAWGERVGLPAYAAIAINAFDGLGANPGFGSRAFSAVLAPWTVVDAARILKFLEADIPSGTPPNILSLLNGDVRWWFFERGYQTFWESLVEKADMDVRLHSPVSSMAFQDGMWTLTIDDQTSQTFKFDKVLVTATPAAALHFLPEGDQRNLIAKAIPPIPANDVFLAEVSGYSASELPDQAAWWPTELGVGSAGLIDTALGGTIKPFFWQKRHADLDVLTVATVNLDPEAAPEQTFEVCRQYALDTLGFNLTRMLHHERFLFPFGVGAADREGWTTGWATLQGQNGLFFSGEAFSGSGVPAITVYAHAVIPMYFPPVAPQTTPEPTNPPTTEADGSVGPQTTPPPQQGGGASSSPWWIATLLTAVSSLLLMFCS